MTLIKLVLIFLFSFCLPFSSTALDIKKGYFEREGQLRPGVQLTLNNETKAVKKAFKKFLRKYYNIRLKGLGLFSDKDELYAENVVLEKINSKHLNFYVDVITSPVDESQTQLTIFAALGYDIYINPQNYELGYHEMISMMEHFAVEYIPTMYDEKIEQTENQISDLKGERKDLNKDIQRLKNDLLSLQKAIKENEQQIENAEEQLKTQKQKEVMANRILQTFQK